jgi:multiple sugar transport system permease protein
MAQQAAPLPSTYGASRQRPVLRRVFGRDWKIGFAFIAPIVLLMTVFIAWPFIRALYTSMTIRNVTTRTDVFVGLDNYIRLYSDPFYRQAVRATVIYTLGSISTKLLFGMIAALLLHGQKRFRNLLTGLILLPWIVPSVVQALTWKSIYDPLFGGLNPILMALGIISEPVSWLSDPRTAMAAVVAVNVWAGIPFFTVNMLAGLSEIDKEMYEASEIDGANAWQQFTQITLPSLRYVIAVATLLSTIWTFNGFETVWLLTQGGPGNMTKVYSILAYQKAIGSLQFGPGTAVAFSLTPVLAGFILLLSRYMRRDVSREEMDVITWQDRVIDAIGWVIGTIGNIIAFPFIFVGSAIGKLLPQGRTASKKRNERMTAILRGVGLTFMLLFVLFPFYWIVVTAFKSELQITQRVDIFWPTPWTTEQFYKLFY